MPSPLLSPSDSSRSFGLKPARATRSLSRPLSIVFWVASVACASFLLHGFHKMNMNSLTPAPRRGIESVAPVSPRYPSIANNDGAVTADMLTRVHAHHFYPANTTHIGHLDTGSRVDDRNVGALKAVAGMVYNQEQFAKRSGYKLIHNTALNKHRKSSPIHLPKGCSKSVPNAWVGEFRNVWMDGSGDIYIPVRNSSTVRGTVDVVHYSFQGGCCWGDWRVAVGTVRSLWRPLGSASAKSLPVTRGCHVKLAFALAQHHGSTFSHIMDDGLTRLFSFWNIMRAVLRRGGKIAVAKHPLFPDILTSYFGISPNSIFQVDFDKPCFFERLILPEAYKQGSYPISCVKEATENVLRSLFLESEPLPVILLLERAQRRSNGNTRCYGRRCMANFHQLRNAIMNEFGNRVVVETVGPNEKGGIRATAKKFNRATVVVGVHGAGFANMMYMRQWGTHIIHLGWNDHMWMFYARKADAHGIEFVNVLSDGASANGDNVKAEIPVILLEIRRALRREGYRLNAPIWKIDPRKSKGKVMRLPRNQRTRT